MLINMFQKTRLNTKTLLFLTKTLEFRYDYKKYSTHSTYVKSSYKMKLPKYKEAKLMQKTSFEQNGGTYRTVGAYKIPNITLPANTNKPLGVWGLKRKDYLINHKRVQYYAYDRNAVDSSYRG